MIWLESGPLRSDPRGLVAEMREMELVLYVLIDSVVVEEVEIVADEPELANGETRHVSTMTILLKREEHASKTTAN